MNDPLESSEHKHIKTDLTSLTFTNL